MKNNVAAKSARLDPAGPRMDLTQIGPACESGGISDEEALAKQMTFQVALIAADGWVLASDTRAYQPPFVQMRDRVIQPAVLSSSSKIVNCPEAALLYSFSGGAFSQETGVVLRKLVPQFGSRPHDELLITAVRDCKHLRPEDRPEGSLIVLFREPKLELWSLHVDRIQPKIEKEWAWAGGGSLALLFPQCFYARRLVSDLKLLAAHAVLTAGLCNPSVVAGLELWSECDGRLSRADDSEISDLTARSKRLHAEFSRLILAGN